MEDDVILLRVDLARIEKPIPKDLVIVTGRRQADTFEVREVATDATVFITPERLMRWIPDGVVVLPLPGSVKGFLQEHYYLVDC